MSRQWWRPNRESGWPLLRYALGYFAGVLICLWAARWAWAGYVNSL